MFLSELPQILGRGGAPDEPAVQTGERHPGELSAAIKRHGEEPLTFRREYCHAASRGDFPPGNAVTVTFEAAVYRGQHNYTNEPSVY